MTYHAFHLFIYFISFLHLLLRIKQTLEHASLIKEPSTINQTSTLMRNMQAHHF